MAEPDIDSISKEEDYTLQLKEFIDNPALSQMGVTLVKSMEKYPKGTGNYGFNEFEVLDELFNENVTGEVYRVRNLKSKEESIAFINEFRLFEDVSRERIIHENYSNQDFIISQVIPKCRAAKVEPLVLLNTQRYVEFVKGTFGVRTRAYISLKKLPSNSSLAETLKAKRNKKESFSESQIIGILTNLAKFIKLCHEEGIGGFNLQPHNIFLEKGIPMLFDVSGLRRFKEEKENPKLVYFENSGVETGYTRPSEECTIRQIDYFSLGMLGLAISTAEAKFAYFNSAVQERLHDYKSKFVNLFEILENLLNETPASRAQLDSIINQTNISSKKWKIEGIIGTEEYFNSVSLKSDFLKQNLINLKLGNFEFFKSNHSAIRSSIDKEFKSETSMTLLINILERALLSDSRKFSYEIIEDLLSRIEEEKLQNKFKLPLIILRAFYLYQSDLHFEVIAIFSKLEGISLPSLTHDPYYLIIFQFGRAIIQYEIGNYEKWEDWKYQGESLVNSKPTNESSYELGVFVCSLQLKWKRENDLFNNFVYYLKNLESLFGREHPEIVYYRCLLGSLNLDFGNILDGFSILEGVVSDTEAVFGREHRMMVDALNRLSQAFYILRNKKKAKDVANLAYKLFLKHYNNDHPNTLGMLNNLAVYASEDGNNVKAISFLEVGIQKKFEFAKDQTELSKIFIPRFVPRHLGFDLTLGHDSELLYMMNNLSLLYHEEMNSKKAEETLVSAFKIAYEIKKFKRNSDFGLDSAYGTLVHNIAVFYEEQGNFDRALYFLNTCLEIVKMKSDDFNPVVLKININKSKVLECQGESEKALDLLLETLENSRKYLAEDNEETAIIHNNLGTLYAGQCLKEKSLEHFQKCLKIRLLLYRANHPILGYSYNNLAIAEGKLGLADAAKTSLSNAIEILSKAGSKVDQRHKAIVQNNLGVNLLSQGNNTDALKVFYDCLESREHLYGGKHPEIGVVWNNLALIYFKENDYEKAEECFKKSLENKRVSLKEGSPSMSSTYYNYGILLQTINQPEKVIKMCEERTARARAEYDPGSIDIASFYFHICEVYQLVGEREKAREFCDKAMEIYKSKYGEQDPRVSMGIEKLKELKFA